MIAQLNLNNKIKKAQKVRTQQKGTNPNDRRKQLTMMIPAKAKLKTPSSSKLKLGNCPFSLIVTKKNQKLSNLRIRLVSKVHIQRSSYKVTLSEPGGKFQTQRSFSAASSAAATCHGRSEDRNRTALISGWPATLHLFCRATSTARGSTSV